MKISFNWLKSYINLDIESSKVAQILTDIGLEVSAVEEYQTIKGGLEGIVIGKVLTCQRHANADKLSLTTVDIGGAEPLHIVCGAPNVEAGQKVVVAIAGAVLYSGNESFTIKKTKIRGEMSEGMICAEDEIGLGTSHAGIMVLPNDARPGMPARDYFNIESDTVFEVELTPNRIDAASHYGVARDVAAYLRQFIEEIELKKPSVENFKIDNQTNKIDIVVENTEACPRYTGITISGVTVSESPEWLQNRLKSIGQKPINNVVDITNFVLHEIGHPLHAFDADKISGKKVIVKTMPAGTPFITLDSEKRELGENDLMICNEKDGMCIAGVFGGIGSGVTSETKNIFLESAYFNPVYVRKTAKKHMLSTDASFRFERGADPNITVYALKRAAMMIREMADGKISSDIIDVYPKPVKKASVELLFADLFRLIGQEIERTRIKSILTSLDITIIAEKEKGLLLDIPTYRVDVRRSADVIEEILRIYGYNSIEVSNSVNSTLSYTKKPDKETVSNIASGFLTSNGFNEIMSNSLTSSLYYENCIDYPAEKLVMLFNPLSQDLNCMRQNLLFGGLEAIAHNINRKNQDLRLYEIGKCYYKEPASAKENPRDNYTEEEHLTLFITGNKETENWVTKQEPGNFFYLKAYVENLLKRFGVYIDNLVAEEIEQGVISEGLVYKFNNLTILKIGKIDKQVCKKFDIDADVFYCDIFWFNVIELLKSHTIKFQELPKFPAVKRDLALLIDKNVRFNEIKEIAFKTETSLLKKVSMFDLYEGEKLGNDKKSYAVSFILQDNNATLTEKQIEKTMNRLIKAYEERLHAKIR